MKGIWRKQERVWPNIIRNESVQQSVFAHLKKIKNKAKFETLHVIETDHEGKETEHVVTEQKSVE